MTRVLVVDDDADIRAEMVEYLTGKGYEVEQAADGLEALEKFEAAPADAVITDIKMPRCDGHELIRRLRAINGHLPIIAIAGTYTPEEIAKVAKRGATEIMKKPIKLRELARHLERWLEPTGD